MDLINTEKQVWLMAAPSTLMDTQEDVSPGPPGPPRQHVEGYIHMTQETEMNGK